MTKPTKFDILSVDILNPSNKIVQVDETRMTDVSFEGFVTLFSSLLFL